VYMLSLYQVPPVAPRRARFPKRPEAGPLFEQDGRLVPGRAPRGRRRVARCTLGLAPELARAQAFAWISPVYVTAIKRGGAPPPLPPPSRTNWTRLVPPSVLTGHVSSLQVGSYCRRCSGRSSSGRAWRVASSPSLPSALASPSCACEGDASPVPPACGSWEGFLGVAGARACLKANPLVCLSSPFFRVYS